MESVENTRRKVKDIVFDHRYRCACSVQVGFDGNSKPMKLDHGDRIKAQAGSDFGHKIIPLHTISIISVAPDEDL